MQAKIPTVALIGRTNVGKSTLFNKLVEEQKSLVSDIAGTTRDRFESPCIWRGKVVRIVDTGGLDVDPNDPIERGVIEQSELAIEQSDLVLFLVDMTVGPTPDDITIAKKLFQAKKPVIVVGNKADTPRLRLSAEGHTWRNWPLGRPLAISAARGTATGDLMDAIYDKLHELGLEPVEISETRPMRVAVIGEPNVGKSTLLNSILGEKRFLASPVAHTSRQPNDTYVHMNGKDYAFIDTAGIRRQNKRLKGGTVLEKHGVRKTEELLRKVDIALFVIDVSVNVSAQAKHLATLVAENGVSVIIIANKWDLIPDKDTNTVNKYEEYIRAMLPQIDYAPIVFISALTRQRVHDVLTVAENVYANRFTELSDAEAKEFISRAISRHKPSKHKGTWHPNITEFVQTRTNPPTFRLTINAPREDALAFSYVKFLERQLRGQFEFEGTPIRVNVTAVQRKHSQARGDKKRK